MCIYIHINIHMYMFYIRVYIYIYTYPHDIPFLPPFHRFVSLLSRCWCMHATAAVVQGGRLLRDFGSLYGAGENAWEGMQRFFWATSGGEYM